MRSSLPWAIRYTNPESMAPHLGVAYQPANAYEGLATLCILAVLLLRQRGVASGLLGLTYLGAVSHQPSAGFLLADGRRDAGGAPGPEAGAAHRTVRADCGGAGLRPGVVARPPAIRRSAVRGGDGRHVQVMIARQFDPTVDAGLATLSVGYAWLARRIGSPRRNALYFCIGLLVVWLALETPLDTLADHYLLIFGQRHLEAVLAEFIEHCHLARPHQGLGQRRPGEPVDVIVATVIRLHICNGTGRRTAT